MSCTTFMFMIFSFEIICSFNMLFICAHPYISPADFSLVHYTLPHGLLQHVICLLH